MATARSYADEKMSVMCLRLKNFSLRISICINRHSSAVPKQPIVPEKKAFTSGKRIDAKTIEHLERLSLVDFANREGIQRLEEAITFAGYRNHNIIRKTVHIYLTIVIFADQIRAIDTTGIEPLITVLEDECLHLREDCVTDGNIRDEILANAGVTEEEYFLAPPGNIPLASVEDKYSD